MKLLQTFHNRMEEAVRNQVGFYVSDLMMVVKENCSTKCSSSSLFTRTHLSTLDKCVLAHACVCVCVCWRKHAAAAPKVNLIHFSS